MRGKVHIALCAAALLASCSGLKYATPDRPLFSDFEVKWAQAPAEARNRITRELEGIVEPAPNNSILGVRPTVALHNMVKEKPEQKGLSNLLRNKIGSEPIYLPDVPLSDINGAFENRLINHGYFQARSRYEVKMKGRKAHVVFFVTPGIPHRIRNINYADSTDTLNLFVARAFEDSPLKAGQLYDLGVLDAERGRVTGTLRNKGWYHLGEDHLVFAADSSVGGHQVDLLLRMKTNTSDEVRQRFRLADVWVHGDYDRWLAPNDTVLLDSVRYINYLNNFRPGTIVRGVPLRPGQWYSERRSELTSRYLSSFGVFKSVNVDHTEDTLRPGLLRTDVFITPQKRWSLFSELNAISKSNNFAGPGIRVGFKDRDVFRGAELLTADINGRFETQVAGAQKGTNAYEINMKIALQIPRIVPFRFLRTVRSSAPSTRADIGYGLFRRVGLYGLESFNTSFGYVWRQNPRVWHDVRFSDISYTSLYYSSPEFDDFLALNPAVRQSFEEQFILGVGYTYTVSTKRRNDRAGYGLVSIGLDESGNLVSAVMRSGGPRSEEGTLLFGRRYSQFVRVRPEFRYYSRLGSRGGRFVARVIAGAAVPYGNSDVVPYVKQFFVGGTNSLRAFRARSVGPGTYVPTVSSGVLIDQVGDIRFEANAEYRFTIAGYFKGAVFGDAGNIWLVNDDPQRPGGKFEWENMLSELAFGAGFGLRFDPDVIVVRLDMATPLRIPSLPPGDRWVFDDFRPRVFDNVVFNIAVGYPF